MSIRQVEEVFPANLEQQIEKFAGLPEDPETNGMKRIPDVLAENSDSSSSPVVLLAKRTGKPSLLHSHSRSSFNEEDIVGGRLHEMLAQYKAAQKDGNAGSRPPSPPSSSSKSKKERERKLSLNTPKSISRSGSAKSSLGGKPKIKKPKRSYKLGRSQSSKEDSTTADRPVLSERTETEHSIRAEDPTSNLQERPARHPGMIKRISLKALPNRRGSHSESPNAMPSLSPNTNGHLTTTKYKSSAGESSEKWSLEDLKRSKSSIEKKEKERGKREKKEKKEKDKDKAAKESEVDEVPEMEFTKAKKGRRRSSSPGSHRSSDSMTILPTGSVLSTAGATMVGVNDMLATVAPDTVPSLKSFRQNSDPGIITALPARWKSTFYTPPEKTRSGHKAATSSTSTLQIPKSGPSNTDFLSPNEAKTGTESKSSNSGSPLPPHKPRNSPRLFFTRSSTEHGSQTHSHGNSKQSSPRLSLTSSSTPSSQQKSNPKKPMKKKGDKKEPFLPLDLAKAIEARDNRSKLSHTESTRTIDSLRILPRSECEQERDDQEILMSPDLSSSEEGNKLRRARLSNDPPILAPQRSKSLDTFTPPRNMKETAPIDTKRPTESKSNDGLAESLSDQVKVSGSAPNSDQVKHRVIDNVTDSEVRKEIRRIEDRISKKDSFSELKGTTRRRRNKASSKRVSVDTSLDLSSEREGDFKPPRKNKSSKKSSRHTTPSNTPTMPRNKEHERQHATIPMMTTEWEKIEATGSPVVQRRPKKTRSGSDSSKTSPQITPRAEDPPSSLKKSRLQKKPRSNDRAKRAQSIESALSPRKSLIDGKTFLPVEEGQSGFRTVGRTVYQSGDEIAGMTLPVLIDVIFELNGPLHRELRDPLLARAFWRTYFLFLPARDLLRELITRLEVIISQTEANPRISFDRCVFGRVDEIVRCWIKFYYFDEDDFEFILRLEKLDKILAKVGARDNSKASLSECLQKMLKESVRLPTDLTPTFNRDIEAAFNMIELEPRDFALQLSIYVHKWIVGLQPIEFFSSLKEFAKRPTPMYTHLCNYHTALSDFVQVTILYGVKKEVRLGSLKYFVEVATECRARNDFFNLSAILCGLSSGPVQRLAALWAMDTKLAEKLRRASEGFFPPGNPYRTILNTLVAEGDFFIPDITLISRDIMHTLENPVYLSPDCHDIYKHGRKKGDLPLVNLDRLRFFDKLFHTLRASQKFRLANWVHVDESTHTFLTLLNRYKPNQEFQDTYYYDRAHDLEQRSQKKKGPGRQRGGSFVANSQDSSASVPKTSGSSTGVRKYFYNK